MAPYVDEELAGAVIESRPIDSIALFVFVVVLDFIYYCGYLDRFK